MLYPPVSFLGNTALRAGHRPVRRPARPAEWPAPSPARLVLGLTDGKALKLPDGNFLHGTLLSFYSRSVCKKAAYPALQKLRVCGFYF